MNEKKHRYSKCYGDGSDRGHCRCGLIKEDPIHDETSEFVITVNGNLIKVPKPNRRSAEVEEEAKQG